MRLSSTDGASVELRAVGYEFPDAIPSGPDDWDANWLVVRGEVRTGTGEAWAFKDPCLATWEAQDLADWLEAAAAGRFPATVAPSEYSDGMLTFLEPNVAFSIARLDEDVVLRVHLDAEAVAGRAGAERTKPWDLVEHVLPLTMSRQALAEAAVAWRIDLRALPQR